jgi:adenylosuccinate synthase
MTEYFPMTLAELGRAEPVYETLPGWDEDVTGARRFEDLPDNARRYIERIESIADVQAAFISVGPGRDETIMCSDPFSN